MPISKKVEKVARALAARRYGNCGGADACTMVKGTPNWRFCIPDATTAVQALAQPENNLAANSHLDVAIYGKE